MSSYSPWCAIPFAPGVRSRCRPVTCASRCERRVAPRSPAPRAGPLSGHPTLPGARFLFAPGVRSRCRSVTCASRCERRVAPRSPAPRAGPMSGHPTLPGARFPSHLESVPAVGQSLALPGAREKSHLGAPPRVPVLRVAFPFFQVRDSPSHLEPEMADIQ